MNKNDFLTGLLWFIVICMGIYAYRRPPPQPVKSDNVTRLELINLDRCFQCHITKIRSDIEKLNKLFTNPNQCYDSCHGVEVEGER